MFFSSFQQGDYIWIHPTTTGEFDVPSGGKILAIEPKRIRIKSDTGSEIYIGKEQVFKNIHISSIKEVEDMINLGDLQEYSILRNLHIRYLNKLIYVSNNLGNIHVWYIEKIMSFRLTQEPC